MVNKIFLYSVLTLFIFNLSIAKVEAVEIEKYESSNEYYSIHLDASTIKKGYTVEAFDELKLSLVPGILNDETKVDMVKLKEPIASPWHLDRISEIYQFEFVNKSVYDDHKPFYIQLDYAQTDNNFKKVYFFDKNFNSWRPLPTRDYPKEKFVRSLIHLPFARIAVFSDPSILTVGKASWYAYKGGNFAASPDFPKGSLLRVYNLENDKYVDVTVNDYGPERQKFPTRVVDLDKVAFKQIASLGAGVASIHIEPLKIAPDITGKVLGAASASLKGEPEIDALAAIAFDEATGKVLYKKNSTSTLPLASLTKLVAIRVFLDTRPSLNQVVEYKYQDEQYNYEWVKKWESARLRVEEGETMTVEDLLYSALVGSANNAVESLVRVSGLKRSEFIGLMNSKVKSWGASSTHFVEPTGLSPKNHTSALDYAHIAKEVFKHPIIEKASKMSEYRFTTLNTSKPHRIVNTNKLVRYTNFNNYEITGSKTGYLDEAGYCLMLRAKAKNGHQIIVVTLGAASKAMRDSETEELLKYALRQSK